MGILSHSINGFFLITLTPDETADYSAKAIKDEDEKTAKSGRHE